MLDMKESWDGRWCGPPTPHRRRDEGADPRQPLYKTISGRFVQSQDYMAMERLYEIHSEGKYDLIVVEHPARHEPLDFLDAPQRMRFFSCGCCAG